MAEKFSKVAKELKNALNDLIGFEDEGYKIGANTNALDIWIQKGGKKIYLTRDNFINLPGDFDVNLEAEDEVDVTAKGKTSTIPTGWKVVPKKKPSPKPKKKSPRRRSRSRSRSSPKKNSPKKVQKTRKVTQYDDKGGVYSSTTLRTWDAPTIASFLMNEADSYEAVLACVLDEVSKRKDSAEAEKVAKSIRRILENTTVDPNLEISADVEEDDDDYEEEEEEMVITKRRSPSPKKRTPSPKKRTPSPKKEDLMEKFETLMEKYHKKAEAKKPTAAIADKLRRMAKELGIDEESLEDDYDFYGFGAKSRKSNRATRRRQFSRYKKGKRRVGKKRYKSVLRKTRKFSKAKKQYYRPRKALRSRKLSFGSPYAAGSSGSIYGLQDGPNWPGVFPMSLNVIEAGANILNVDRDYRLFGAKSRRRKRRYSGKKLKPRRMKFKSGKKHTKYAKRRSYGVFKPPSPLTIV